ncbi:SMI1/KNR4 family protein [Coleofasciculus sp. FACHB-SPT36]|uniref:SMI1/KNR4 family protein n=1 Tax=Cyanophyceae TaxID=3028117 RepID=UPI00168B2BB4|nr:SMI1/KNR4 family protein [Coleofasciculus sp. FACHB-SPT36]MBD2540945.1 SMI1/KNR4 family protein [Coleofasciculus sp. FACHB-SPT36]
MSISRLIERLNDRAHDSARATDLGHGILDGKGNPVFYVAHSPALPQHIVATEELLGFQLPDLLREMYLKVGNGGFGPGYGLIGVKDGMVEAGSSITSFYVSSQKTDPDEPMSHWPDRLLPICSWGCGIYSCIDCSKPNSPIIVFDPNASDYLPWEECFIPYTPSFEAWIEAWLD